MKYTIKAHPTIYKDTLFRSRLEARWAAFFDLAGWEWEYEPIDLNGWSPDFRVVFPCSHSECRGYHSLLVEIKPCYSINDFDGHPCRDYAYGCRYDEKNGELLEERIPADASAAFGNKPSVSEWEMSHGAGGGIESIHNWVYGDIDKLWEKAGAITQYKLK